MMKPKELPGPEPSLLDMVYVPSLPGKKRIKLLSTLDVGRVANPKLHTVVLTGTVIPLTWLTTDKKPVGPRFTSPVPKNSTVL